MLDLTFHDDLAEQLAVARERGVWIFGNGQFARALHHALRSLAVPVRGFLTSTGPSGVTDGVPVVPIHDASPRHEHDVVWVGVFNHQPNANYEKVYALCKGSGFGRVLLPTQFFEVVSAGLGWRYWLTQRSDYQAHAAELHAALELMADEESRACLSAVVDYRLGRLRQIPSAHCSDPHYFPKIMASAVARRGHPLVLVDGGAYDGDTLATALANMSLESAFAFEPDLKNYAALTRRAQALPVPVVCFPCGLSAEARSLRFNSGQGEASAISAAGDQVIQVVSLDECLPQTRVDYIKLDVEGHEMDALRGAVRTIGRHRPALAIAGYHRASDLWNIPNFIGGLGAGYKIYLRVHTENSFDLVFYAV